jgi:hypothetical protein
MNRQKTITHGQTANTASIICLQLLVVMHYLVMYTITVKNQYKRGAKMNKKENMAKIENLPIEEKYKLLSKTDQAYIRGFIERAFRELKKAGTKKTSLPIQKHKKENQK